LHANICIFVYTQIQRHCRGNKKKIKNKMYSELHLYKKEENYMCMFLCSLNVCGKCIKN
jgi:hypothetical protein